MPKISVIVPVYKAEAYLHACIDSILSQTFADFEVILVDDGSPDRSGVICDEYAVRDSRISVIHQTNQGQAAARNHALMQARGEWICYVDSDDLIHPQMLALLYHGAVKSGAAISMCQMLEAEQLPQDFFQTPDEDFAVLEMNEETLVKLHDMDAYPSWVACAKLIRKALIEKHPFCEGRVFEDNEAVCHWVCAAEKMAMFSQKLYFYRTNPISTTKSSFSMKKLDYLWALENIIRFYGSIGYGHMRQRFLDRYIDAVIFSCNGVRYTLGQPAAVKAVERDAKRFLREQKMTLTKEQFEGLLDATHPKLIRLYWPLEGVMRTLRNQGISGVIRKITNVFWKGESQ